MYFTYLLTPDDFDSFNSNSLSVYENYVFIVVPSAAEYERALRKFGHLLNISQAFCVLVDQDRLASLVGSTALGRLFEAAASEVPEKAVSYIAAINRKEVMNGTPRGTWIELFLLLEQTETGREKKLLRGIQEALQGPPKDYSAFGPDVAKLMLFLVRLIAKPHS